MANKTIITWARYPKPTRTKLEKIAASKGETLAVILRQIAAEYVAKHEESHEPKQETNTLVTD